MSTITCIGCPMGCQLQVDMEETDQGPVILDVKGYECSRGKQYAQDETTRPLRMVTTLVPIHGSRKPLSVRTRVPIPKDLIFDCLKAIHSISLRLPIKAGDCVLADVSGTGVDVIATCD